MSFRISDTASLRAPLTAAFLCVALSACVTETGTTPTAETGVQIGYTPNAAPVNRRTGVKEPGCWALDYEPAVTETTTQNVQVQGEKLDRSGNVTEPAIWRSETITRIVTPRQELNFETPCANMLTEEFLISLQRSLQARDLYDGQASGRMDSKTRQAIRRFQLQNGLNSAYLSLENARALGLVEVPRPEGTQDPAPEPDLEEITDI